MRDAGIMGRTARGHIGPYHRLGDRAAMRREEVVAMRWDHLDRKARGLLMIPEMKTGTSRRAPLSTAALGVLDLSIAHIFGDFL